MAPAVKKVPQRMCVTCRERKNKKELIRIVLMPDGLVCVDSTGKKPGRGVYTCKNKVCLLKAIKSHRIEKGLKAEVSSDVIDSLFEQAVLMAQED